MIGTLQVDVSLFYFIALERPFNAIIVLTSLLVQLQLHVECCVVFCT